MLPLAAVAACALVAIDGDTLRCGRERLRLVAIDAPELPGHCRRGRVCAPGDPWRSKASLATMLDGPAVIERLGRDLYGRPLVAVKIAGRDLACEQLRSGNAIYVPRWDPARIIARRCPDALERR